MRRREKSKTAQDRSAIDGHIIPRKEKNQFNKSEQVAMTKFLKNFVKSRLFGRWIWLADYDDTYAMKRMLWGMGLLEPRYDGEDPNDPDKIYLYEATPFGVEQNIELVLGMAGGEDFCEEIVPRLIAAELMVEIEGEIINARWSAGGDIEEMLRPFVMRAYYEYYHVVPRSNEDPLMVPLAAAA
jgi:hypothetical protein